MKELLDNAVLSIELGVEDFQSDDKRRLLSAIRNVYAGLLLLCKQVLWDASPDGSDGSLIYKDLVPKKLADGSVVMGPRKLHRNTVDRRLIEERFKALGLDLEWKALGKIADIRNDAEHLFLRAKPSLAREVLSSALPLIEQLVAEHLEDDPKYLFSDDCWKALLENREVFEKQAARCLGSFDAVNWDIGALAEALGEVRCPDCGSSLLRQLDPDNEDFESIELECVECSSEPDREDVFEAALVESTSGDAYIAMTDGGEPPIHDCLECGRSSWVLEEGGCVFCGTGPHTCGLCGEICLPDDFNYDEGTCSYCAWRMDKVKRE